MENNEIYMDYQAAKPVDPNVVSAMTNYYREEYGNPSSLHKIGDRATEALAESRKIVSNYIGARPNEFLFTSGATESNNLAIMGYALKNYRKGKHIIISEVEHISVHNIAKYLTKNGFSVSKVPVDQFGRVRLDKLESRIKEDTILISIQTANNEIGTIQPMKEIGQIAHNHGIAFHTDAVAAQGLMNIDVNALNVDLMSISSNDFYGPKGVGALYTRKGFRVQPIQLGGGQEYGIRSGSENVAGIVGMAQAVKLMESKFDSETKRLQSYRDKLIKEILEITEDSHLNGHPVDRLVNNAHFRFDAIEGESILLSFKQNDIAVSTGSACSSKTLEPSHTLIATGLLHEEAHGSLELTVGRFTELSDVDRVIEIIPDVITRLRNLSPLYKKKVY